MMRVTNLFRLLTLAILLISITGCGANSPVVSSQPEEVSVRLKWVHQTQFAGIYMAEKNGYYAAENLDVTIEPVDYEQMLSAEKVTQGKNTFGIGSADEVLVARSQGMPVRAIAVIYRINPLVYMSLGNTELRTPQDLIGKKIIDYRWSKHLFAQCFAQSHEYQPRNIGYSALANV